MANDPFGRLARGFVQGRELRQQRQNNTLDQALKQAQLQEAGYSWDGRNLIRDENMLGIKSIERLIKQNELEDIKDPTRVANREAQKFGAIYKAINEQGQPSQQAGAIDQQIEELKAELERRKQGNGVAPPVNNNDPLGVLV